MASQFQRNCSAVRLAHERTREQLTGDYERRKYLASGGTVFERVYNRENQAIEDLVKGLAEEALPSEWGLRVVVEEFTHFLLLVHVDGERNSFEVHTFLNRILPLIEHASPYLGNVAVFDTRHTCFLFLDYKMLRTLGQSRTLHDRVIAQARQQGEAFERFNSIKIPSKSISGHIVLAVEVSGPGGVVQVPMMLDTGASTSLIGYEVARETGQEDLDLASTEVFSTVAGPARCSIVRRTLCVGGVQRTLQVAVPAPSGTGVVRSPATADVNLLGVDFLKGFDYLIDTRNECVYLWAE